MKKVMKTVAVVLILSLFFPYKSKAMSSFEKDSSYNRIMKQDLLCLMMAYPEYVIDIKSEADGRVYVLLKSARKLIYDDMKQKNSSEKLYNPDLQDMMEQIYPLSPVKAVLEENIDPGRYRVYGLFSEVYGSSRKEIESKLVSLKSGYSNYRFNGSNGAADSLNAAMKELIPLARQNPSINNCIYPSSGTYNYRLISGTNQLSPHSYGIAIDLAVNKKDYWKWSSRADGSKRLSNYPNEIAEVFESHNFIWGGKWGHFDIMHYEYRPEIILKARYFNHENTIDEPWYHGVPLEDEFIKNSIDKINRELK